tara:strand:+ start:3332 stop:3784 length:453 start_codon:yes stop_codon:yes gene_type:complete
MASNSFSYLEGVMFFPYIFDFKDKFDRYSVALGLEGDQVKQAKKLGLAVKQEDDKMDGMPYVQLKSNYKPNLFDAEENEYKGPTQLSNGSKCVVSVSQRAYNNKYGEGTTTFMNAIKITDPIEYVSQGSSTGFRGNPTTKSDTLDDDIPF